MALKQSSTLAYAHLKLFEVLFNCIPEITHYIMLTVDTINFFNGHSFMDTKQNSTHEVNLHITCN